MSGTEKAALPPSLSQSELSPAPQARADAAANVPGYIADLCSGMIDMAETAQLEMLVYLLRMVRLEADLLRREAEEATRRGTASPRR